MARGVKKIDRNLELIWKALETRLSTDESLPVNQSELAKELGIAQADTSTAIRSLIRKGILLQEGKQGQVKCYQLAFKPVKTETAIVDNHIITRTPTGTELLSVFDFLGVDEVALDTQHREDEYYDEDWDDDEEDDEEDEDDWRPPGRRRKKYKRPLRIKAAPELFFQFVKSKLNEDQKVDLSGRILKLTGMIRSAELIGQTALYETLAMELAGIVRQQEVAAIGLGKWVDELIINRVVEKIEKIKYSELENFPRVIPKEVMEKIIAVRNTNIFDSYHVLYMDGSGQKELRTTEEKIKKKDPILFGKISQYPNRVWYIIDWTDEFCDLTLEKMIEHVKVDDPEFKLNELGIVDQAYVDSILEDVKKRHLALRKTNPRTYRRLMRQQKRETKLREKEARELYTMSGTNEEDFIKKIVSLKGKDWLNSVIEATTPEPKREGILFRKFTL
jgi:hypothetical protein